MKRVSTLLLLLAACTSPRETRPLRELVVVDGTEPVTLSGWGLVVGLPGTGDSISRFIVLEPAHYGYYTPDVLLPLLLSRKISQVHIRVDWGDSHASVSARGSAMLEGGQLVPTRISDLAGTCSVAVGGRVLDGKVLVTESSRRAVRTRGADGVDCVRLCVLDPDHVPSILAACEGARIVGPRLVEVPLPGALSETLDLPVEIPHARRR